MDNGVEDVSGAGSLQQAGAGGRVADEAVSTDRQQERRLLLLMEQLEGQLAAPEYGPLLRVLMKQREGQPER